MVGANQVVKEESCSRQGNELQSVRGGKKTKESFDRNSFSLAVFLLAKDAVSNEETCKKNVREARKRKRKRKKRAPESELIL